MQSYAIANKGPAQPKWIKVAPNGTTVRVPTKKSKKGLKALNLQQNKQRFVQAPADQGDQGLHTSASALLPPINPMHAKVNSMSLISGNPSDI